MNIFEHNKSLVVKHHQQFKNIFHYPLQAFMHPITGFDIIKFDEEVVESGDKAMRDTLLENYGQEAVDLIKALI